MLVEGFRSYTLLTHPVWPSSDFFILLSKRRAFQAVDFWMDNRCLQDSLYHTMKPLLSSLSKSHHPSEIGQTGGYTYFERLASISHGPREFWSETEELLESFLPIQFSQFLTLLVTHSCCLLHLV